MKTLKAICTAMVLALALSIPTYAGDISTPGLTTPGETIPGEIHTPGLTGDVSTPGATSTIPGEISTPGLIAILGNLFSVF